MKTNINFRKINRSNEITNYINKRISSAFSRVNDAIQTTSLTVSDINGPKGGIDKECTIVIKAAGIKPIVICEQQSKLHNAIDRCISRANQVLMKQLQKRNKISKTKLMKHMFVPQKVASIRF